MSRDWFGTIPVVDGLGFARGIMVLDDMEGTMTWVVAGTGGDDVHALAAAAAFQGTYGLSLATRVTAAAEDDYVQVVKQFGYPESGLLVARCKILGVDVSAIKTARLNLQWSDGIRLYSASVHLMMSAGTCQYLAAAGTYTAIAGLAMTFTDAAWYTFELAVDCRTNEYVHAFCNGERVDLSDIAVYDTGADTAQRALVGIAVYAAGAASAAIYVDNVYVGEMRDA